MAIGLLDDSHRLCVEFLEHAAVFALANGLELSSDFFAVPRSRYLAFVFLHPLVGVTVSGQ